MGRTRVRAVSPLSPILIAVSLFSQGAWAQSCPSDSLSLTQAAADSTGPRPEFVTLPSTPTAPPQLAVSTAHVQSFGCLRQFRVDDKVYSLDSYHRADGENLRPFLRDVPQALEFLDTYQQNQRSQTVAAYLGTAGLLTAVAGFVFVNGTTDPDLRRILLFGGLGLAAGSFGYSLAVAQTNEANVRRAVDAHNAAKPAGKRIELVLEAGLNF
jgi:hypothetical protein